MEVKPGYKQTEVGVIPEEWEVPALDALGSVIRGASPRPKGDKRYYGGEVPRLMVEDVTRDKKHVIPRIDFLTVEGAKRSRPCKSGTLTIVCSGTPGVVGTPSFLAVDACIHDGMMALVNISKRVFPDYLYHQLSSYQEKLYMSATHGGTFVNLTTAGFRAFKVALPSTDSEQRAIAEALSDVDGLLGALDRLIAKKRDLKQAAMQQLLTGQTRLPGFTGEWKPVVLGHLLTMRATYGIVTAGDFKSTGVPMMRGGDIKEGRIGHDLPFVSSEKCLEYSRTILKRDDVVIALVGYPGESAKVPQRLEGANISRAVGLLRLNHQVAPDFLVSYLNSPMGRRMVLAPSAGSAQLVVNLAALNKLEFLLPTPPEQVAIAEVLSDMDAELVALEQRREKTRALKQGMMQELLTGKTRLVSGEGRIENGE